MSRAGLAEGPSRRLPEVSPAHLPWSLASQRSLLSSRTLVPSSGLCPGISHSAPRLGLAHPCAHGGRALGQRDASAGNFPAAPHAEGTWAALLFKPAFVVCLAPHYCPFSLKMLSPPTRPSCPRPG